MRLRYLNPVTDWTLTPCAAVKFGCCPFHMQLGFLAVLTVVHTEREGATRVISFRHASSEEREVYGAWLQYE